MYATDVFYGLLFWEENLSAITHNAQRRAKRTSDTADSVSTAVILSEPGRLETGSEVGENRRRFRMDGR